MSETKRDWGVGKEAPQDTHLPNVTLAPARGRAVLPQRTDVVATRAEPCRVDEPDHGGRFHGGAAYRPPTELTGNIRAPATDGPIR